MTFKVFDVVVVPFPFSDQDSSKRRPAVILSDENTFGNVARHSVIAMITTRFHPPWPLDTMIRDLDAAGLPSPSIIRLKLFTVDHRLVIKVLGHLSDTDQVRAKLALQQLFHM